MNTTNDELWRVQLSTGEIRMMTLDALDRAFDEGLIDSRVPVLPPGASAWTTLGQAAGLDDCPTEETPSLSPIAIANPAPSSAAAVPLSEDTKPALDLDLPDTFEEMQPRPRRGLVIGGTIGAAALAAIALLAGNVGSSAQAPVDVKAAAAVQAPPPAAVEALPAPVAKEAMPKEAMKEAAPKEAATPDAPKEAAQEPKAGLSDWQKRMLAEADKPREDKARPKNQERAEKPAQPPKAKPQQGPSRMSNGLLNGGDKFDPLNGAL